MLILKRNSICMERGPVKCTLKVVESKKPIYVMFFVWTLYLMLAATSDIRCSSMSSAVFWIGSLFARVSNFSTLHLVPIHPLPRERKLKRNHVAAKLANHLSGNLTFGVGSRAHNWLQSYTKMPGGVNMVYVFTWRDDMVCRFSHDVTKNETTKLLILLRFNFMMYKSSLKLLFIQIFAQNKLRLNF